MSYKFCGGFATYMGQNARNKMMEEFTRGKKAAVKEAVVTSRKVAITSTLTNDVSQRHSCNESDIFRKTSGTSKSTQDETKKVVDQGEFI